VIGLKLKCGGTSGGKNGLSGLLPVVIHTKKDKNSVGKLAKKQSGGVRFVNSALKIQCPVVKNTFHFLAF